HATAERRLEEATISIGSGTPAHGIEKGFQRIGIVLPGDGGQTSAFDDMRARLDFPDHLEFFAESILIDGGQRDGMLVHATQLGSVHLSHYPLPASNFDEL